NCRMHDRPVCCGVAQLTEPPDIRNCRLARAIGIGLAVLFGCRNDRSDLCNAGCQRLVDPALVQREGNAVRAGKGGDRRNDVAHVDKLRKGLRRQERADLEMPYARGIFLAHPALLCSCRGKGLDELKAVAQSHLAQGDSTLGIDLSDVGHARFLSGFEASSELSSARTIAVSAPRSGTFKPSPIFPPFHCTGSAGTRKGAPSTLTLLTSPPGRSTCGSLNRSSGRLIGEKQILS